jgi:hypothetical protein
VAAAQLEAPAMCCRDVFRSFTRRAATGTAATATLARSIRAVRAKLLSALALGVIALVGASIPSALAGKAAGPSVSAALASLWHSAAT